MFLSFEIKYSMLNLSSDAVSILKILKVKLFEGRQKVIRQKFFGHRYYPHGVEHTGSDNSLIVCLSVMSSMLDKTVNS